MWKKPGWDWWEKFKTEICVLNLEKINKWKYQKWKMWKILKINKNLKMGKVWFQIKKK